MANQFSSPILTQPVFLHRAVYQTSNFHACCKNVYVAWTPVELHWIKSFSDYSPQENMFVKILYKKQSTCFIFLTIWDIIPASLLVCGQIKSMKIHHDHKLLTKNIRKGPKQQAATFLMVVYCITVEPHLRLGLLNSCFKKQYRRQMFFSCSIK